jgi:RNA polymerase sigma-70 factor (ECF subfamily)
MMLESTHQPAPLTPESAGERDREFAAATLPLMPNVKRYALALTRNESDADDIVQETYLRAHRYWRPFDSAGDCRRWLLTICRNAFHTIHQREGRSVAVEDDELESLAAARAHNAARAAGVDDMYARLDLGPAIQAAIEQLDTNFRDVVVLSDVEGFSYEEIAEMLGIPLGTVRSRLFRARRQLQESLMVYAIDAGFARANGTPIRIVAPTEKHDG